LSGEELEQRITQAGVVPADIGKAKDLLIWFGFLGYWLGSETERFSYEYQHDLQKLRTGLPDQPTYTIHRAFRSALEIAASE